MELSGVLMAGGKSSRMNQDKGLILYKGEMMASYGLKILEATCQASFISTNNSHYDVFDVPLIHDIYKEIGPMGGLHAALVNSHSDHVLLLGCDLPNLTVQFVEQLKTACKHEDAVIPLHGDGHIEPLAAIYSKSILPFLESMIQKKDFRMHRLLSNVNTTYINVDQLVLSSPKLFQNINTLDQVL